MTYVEPPEDTTPVAHATIAYLGPVAPHWEIRGHFGDPKLIDAFWTRVTARLLLLPRHDPQFRRNKERVNRDAERELITLDWDLGDEEPKRRAAPVAAVAKPVVETAPVAEIEPVAEVEPVAEAAPEAPAEAESPVEAESPSETPEA